MSQQLDQGLAGAYSLLSAELQLPLIQRVLYLMEQDGELPPIPEGLISPQITTGVEAIGRGNDKGIDGGFFDEVAVVAVGLDLRVFTTGRAAEAKRLFVRVGDGRDGGSG